MKCLHITNGDTVVELLTASGVGGTVLPWRDVLHDGPVPPRPLHELSAVRAEYIAGCGWGQFENVLADFRQRDAVLETWRDFDEVVLWFEYDLYDQLQILQILSWFAQRVGDGPPLHMICIDRFPGVEEFHGLGQLKPTELTSLWDQRSAVSATMFELACAAWTAFTARTPVALAGLAEQSTDPLPFLRPALRRWCEEFPAVHNGLGRSRKAALTTLVDGPMAPGRSFAAYQQTESARYLGDWCYWCYLKELAACPVPLIAADGAPFTAHRSERRVSRRFSTQSLSLTAAGRRVLAAELDHIDLNGIDSWRGGVHLRSQDHWRWDDVDNCFRQVMVA